MSRRVFRCKHHETRIKRRLFRCKHRLLINKRARSPTNAAGR
jgi:hypothetical protein